MRAINILGTEYHLSINDSIISLGVDGLCKSYDKEILIRSKENMLSPDDSDNVKLTRQNEVMRHELIHAFFTESGLDDYSNDEQLVTWIACQWPKIQQVFEELGVN